VQLVVAGQPADAPRVHAETMPSVAGESQGGARRFDPTTDPPSVLFLSMSTSNLCNFRCKHCHIWMNDDAANELSTQERVEVIRQFSRLGNGGTVVLPGGEVTMDCDELFALSGACRELGLGCAITTNGSAIVTPDFATRIASSGITAITVSLDGHRRELHEYTRGIPGCFDTTVRALRLLVEARRRSGSPLQVMASCVVFDRNVEVLEEYVEFCRELGLDHVDLQMLSRTFSNRHPRRDVFFERHFWWDEESKMRAKEALRGVIENSSREAGFLLKGVESLDWIFSYIEDPDFRTSRPICGSHERNLVVSTRGDVSLCFNAAQIFSEPAVGNIRESTLAEIWRGRQSQEYRLVMDVCRLNCGALNCHRRRESPLS
jgi:MoaA/NifB/PqqE/SkfB family radical SAM enzyme